MADSSKTYEEQTRVTDGEKSMGLHVDELWREPDVSDDGGYFSHPRAEVIINTDEQRPVTEEEREYWCDDINDHIREMCKYVE